jgi:hypothetical protein
VVPIPLRVVRACLFRGVWELLVQWEGHSAEGATWMSSRRCTLEDELFQGREEVLWTLAMCAHLGAGINRESPLLIKVAQSLTGRDSLGKRYLV